MAAGTTGDLAALTSLDESILVHELDVRYSNDDIYVRTAAQLLDPSDSHIACDRIICVYMRVCEERRAKGIFDGFVFPVSSHPSLVALAAQTYIGDILIAINPFRPLNIYSEQVQNAAMSHVTTHCAHNKNYNTRNHNWDWDPEPATPQPSHNLTTKISTAVFFPCPFS